ncbi:MAG: 50S ribosomal protein L25 [Bdellovibrionaceae bacterium]|nr:50S ribosomal protein L25 [Pseudobdellovibrionaceae bacterium]
MKTQIEISVSPRQTGKHFSRASRLAAQIPAVIYGPKVANTSLLTDELSVKKFGGRKFESTIFKLKSEDPKLNGQAVLFKSVQVHPVTRRPVHVDFYAVDMTKPIRVRIEIRLEGKPIGLADGGFLQAVVRELEIEVLPTAIPEFVTADVSNLGVGDSLHVSDIQVPAGVKVITRAEQTIATVSVLAEEAAAPVAAAAPAEGAAAAAPAAGAAAAAPAADAKAGDKAKK